MSEYTKHLVPRPELRERIIDTAVEAFSAHGIKSITMILPLHWAFPNVPFMKSFRIRKLCWKSAY